MRHRISWVTAFLLGIGACRPAANYRDPVQPRYAGEASAIAPPKDTLKVVSFNIEYGKETRRAVRFMKASPVLRDADIVLLQEMNPKAAKLAADSLGMHYVYYPAIYNRILFRDVGNAVLSRWPIVQDAKVILPARSRYAKTQRIATAATVQIGSRTVRVYSTHLGTPADLSAEGRAEQLGAIMADAAQYEHVILAGDMNSPTLGLVAREKGYLWPTDTIPKSNAYGRLDHFFLRGFTVVSPGGAGTVRLPPQTSDHNPIWIRIALVR